MIIGIPDARRIGARTADDHIGFDEIAILLLKTELAFAERVPVQIERCRNETPSHRKRPGLEIGAIDLLLNVATGYINAKMEKFIYCHVVLLERSAPVGLGGG
jgi:hypothetical protein